MTPPRPSAPAAGDQTTLPLKAKSTTTAILQMRGMRRNPRQTPEDLAPTRDVAISPPMAKLHPRQELTERILRVARKPVRGQDPGGTGPETRAMTNGLMTLRYGLYRDPGRSQP